MRCCFCSAQALVARAGLVVVARLQAVDDLGHLSARDLLIEAQDTGGDCFQLGEVPHVRFVPLGVGEGGLICFQVENRRGPRAPIASLPNREEVRMNMEEERGSLKKRYNQKTYS